MNRYQFFEKLKFRENVIDGKREQHVGKIQRIYDITKSEAKEQATDLQKHSKPIPLAGLGRTKNMCISRLDQ